MSSKNLHDVQKDCRTLRHKAFKGIVMNLSKTQTALSLIAQGRTIEEAAGESGAAVSTIRVALWKQKGREVCPCCGQIVRSGFECADPVPVAMRDLVEAIEATPQATPTQIVAHIRKRYLK